jgi:hypothetical protein
MEEKELSTSPVRQVVHKSARPVSETSTLLQRQEANGMDSVKRSLEGLCMSM